jgi:hypothetical protein
MSPRDAITNREKRFVMRRVLLLRLELRSL